MLSAPTCAIQARYEIYLITDLFHVLDLTNFEYTDMSHTDHIQDLFKYRPFPYTRYDDF